MVILWDLRFIKPTPGLNPVLKLAFRWLLDRERERDLTYGDN